MELCFAISMMFILLSMHIYAGGVMNETSPRMRIGVGRIITDFKTNFGKIKVSLKEQAGIKAAKSCCLRIRKSNTTVHKSFQ